MQSVIDLTDKILSLTTAQPKACQISARRLIATRDGMKKLVVFFDNIGLEYARQLFDRITSSQWRILKELSNERSNELDRPSEGKILLEIYTEFLIETMSTDASDFSEDPFSFLKELNNYELSSILGKEDPTQIAFISLHWGMEEMSHLLGCLKPELKRQVILQILRLERLPQEVLEKAGSHFASIIKQRFQGLFDDSKLEFDTAESPDPGTEVIQRIVSQIDLDQEQQMLDYIKTKSTSIKLQLKDLKDI